MTTLIKNAHIVTQNARREILKGDILLDNGKIAAIGKVTDSADEEIDAQGDIVMPGLINTHCHVAMATMKAVADDVTFPNFLDRVFALDSKRTEKDIRSGAALGCLEIDPLRHHLVRRPLLFRGRDRQSGGAGRAQRYAMLGSARRRIYDPEGRAAG